MDSYIYIIDDLIFFCTGLLLLYLFVMAVASHFKHITYPKAQKTYRCAILVPEGSLLPEIYKEESYEFITYSDLHQAINSLDQEHYDLVLFLSHTASALFLGLDVYLISVAAIMRCRYGRNPISWQTLD